LGAAYTKLGLWEKAQAAFEGNEERHPNAYETASNLGVMYKKMGEYSEAETWIRKSLQIKSGGHMGLGDYYLLMIQWKQEQGQSIETGQAAGAANAGGSQSAPRAKNFLGVAYDAGPAKTATVANKEYVVTLIKNDIAFSDAYLVLGDILFVEEDFQMALRAYYRASSLSNEQKFVAHGRIARDRQNAVIEQWRSASHPGHVIEEGPGSDQQLEEEVAAAADWLENYQRTEAEFIEKGLNVSFAALKPEVKKRGFTKPRLLEAIHYEGTATAETPQLPITRVAMGLFAVFVALFVLMSFAVVIVVFFVLRSRPPSSGKMVKT
jgi:tetratricopeptide (TPR) repeat protein